MNLLLNDSKVKLLGGLREIRKQGCFDRTSIRGPAGSTLRGGRRPVDWGALKFQSYQRNLNDKLQPAILVPA